MSHKRGVRVLHSPGRLITGVAFVFLQHNKVGEDCCENQDENVVDRSDFLGDYLVYVSIKVFFQLTDAFLVV